MDAFEREARIEQLQRANAESLWDLEERQAARESDPFLEQERLFADAEPAGSLPVSKSNEPEVIYRRYDGNAARGGSEGGATDWSGWERWMEGHLNNLRKEMHETVAHALGEFWSIVREEERAKVEREFAVLKNENAELRGMLTDMLAKLDAADTKVRNFMADLEGERRERRALEVEMAEQRGRTNAIVRDLVR